MRLGKPEWLLVLLVALSAERALACAAPLRGLQWGSSHVAPDGGLSLLFACDAPGCTADSKPPLFRVFDAASNEVTGSVSKFGLVNDDWLWLVWRPTLPLAADARFTVLQDDRPAWATGPSWTFDTSAPIFDPRTVQPSFTATLVDAPAGQSVCCELTPTLMSCDGNSPCFLKQRQQGVSLSVDTDELPTSFDVVYRTTFRVGEQVTTTESPFPESSFLSRTVAGSYCYSLDALRVATDELIHVADGCQTLVVSSFATRELTDGELRESLSACVRPPEGYEADWSRLGLPAWTPPGQRDASTMTSANVSLGANDAGLEPNDAGLEPDVTTDDGGCALAQSASLQGGAWSALLALALLVRRRRA